MSLSVGHLTTTLPVVDGEVAVGVLAYHVDGASHVKVGIEDRPLLAVGPYLVVAYKVQELLSLALHADRLRLSVVQKVTHGVEDTILKVVLRLLVHECTHVGRHTPYAFPLGQRLSHGYAIARLLLLSHTLGIERLEEVSNERADGQHTSLATKEVDVILRQEVDVIVLRVASGISKTTHLLRHGFSTRIHSLT